MATPRDIVGWTEVPSRESQSGLQAGGGGRPVVAALQFYMPEVYPIPGAHEFSFYEILTTPAAGITAFPNIAFVLPQSAVGIIRVISSGVDDMTNATRLTFRLRVNGGLVEGPAGGLVPFAGVAARVTVGEDVFVCLPLGSQITGEVLNTDGAAYQVGLGYSGWWWPEALGTAWKEGR
jgi:hypothetical protein